MASATAAKEQYFVILPDLPTADRPRVRPLHMARLNHAPASHTVFMGGAVLDSQPTTSSLEGIKMTGSAVVLEFDTAGEKTLEEKKEKVRKYLRQDPYVVEGVWDVEKAQIWPFKVGYSGEPGVAAR